VLADALVSHPSLTLLELGYNPLGPAGAATITGALDERLFQQSGVSIFCVLA
jgi:hypothetical protein